MPVATQSRLSSIPSSSVSVRLSAEKSRALGANGGPAIREVPSSSPVVSDELALDLAGIGRWELDLFTGAIACDARFDSFIGCGDIPTLDGLLTLVHADDRAKLERAIEALRTITVEKPGTLDVVFRTSADRWLVARGRTVYGDNGSFSLKGVLAPVHDDVVALLRDAQSTASMMTEVALASEDRLAYVSHELRHPLNAVLGWSRILLDELDDLAERGGDHDRLRTGLRVIAKQATAQARLIEDLLENTRSRAGKLSLAMSVVAMRPALEDALTTLRFEAEAKAISLQATFDPQLGSVVGDVDRLSRIFVNLLANAVKFTPRGGCVALSAARAEDRIIVKITDSGTGIEPLQLPFIFDRFWQAPRSPGGIGLGLAIVRELVELHGGRVGVMSEGRGFGSTFEVSLPAGNV